MALTDNLVSYWKLDESSGNASDSVGSNTLTNTNTATYSSGLINNGANFVAGSSQRLGGTLTGLPTSGDFTLACWWKGTTPVGDGIFGYGSGTSTGVARQILIASGDAYFGGYSADLNSNFAIDDGSWHHVVVTYSGTTLKIYVDASEKNSTTVTLNTSDQAFNIGARADSSSHVTGSVDEGGIWSRALTPTEVTELYGSGSGNQYPFGTDYTETLNETISLVDGVTKQAEKDVSETLTLVDTIVLGVEKTINDTIALVASVISAMIFTKSFDETIILSDTAETQIIGKTFFETVTLNATLTRIVMYSKVFTDALVLGSSINLGRMQDVDETLSLAETCVKVGVFARNLNEVLTIEIRFQGLLNGQDISWFRKYTEQAGTFIKKYLPII